MNRKQHRKQSRSKIITRRAGVTYLTVAGVIGGTLGVAGPAYANTYNPTNCSGLITDLGALADTGGSLNAPALNLPCEIPTAFEFEKTATITGPTTGELVIEFTGDAGRGFTALTPSGGDSQNVLTIRNLTLKQDQDFDNERDGDPAAIDPADTKIDWLVASNTDADLVIENTKFVDSEFGENTSAAILAQGRNVSITDSVFEDLTSEKQGSAIDLNGASSLTVAGSTFKDIVSVGHGGAIFGDSQDSLSIDSSNFVNVTSGGNSGGAIYVDGGDLLAVSDSSFTDVAGRSGGSIYVEGTDAVTVTGTQFINSRATSNGGSLFVESVGSFAVHDSTFTTNASFVTSPNGSSQGMTADGDGGAIYSDQGTSRTFAVTDSIFSNLKSSRGGAIHEVGTATLSVSGSTFNNLDVVGRTIPADGADPERVIAGKGGAIYGEGNNGSLGVEGDLTVTDSTFSDLTSADEGGAIFSEGSLTVSRSSFFENSSQTDGGAISSTSITAISDSTFTENTSQTEGGAVSSASDLAVSGSTFTENTSQTEGGAIFSQGPLTVDGSYFFKNTSLLEGGAIRSIFTDMDNSTFVDNSASNGAAFSSMSEGSVISNNTFWNNGDIDSSAIEAYETAFFGNILANTVGPVLSLPVAQPEPNQDLGANLYTDGSFEVATGEVLEPTGISVTSIADGSSKQVTLDELMLSAAALNTTMPVNTGKTKTVALRDGSVARDYYSSTSAGLNIDPGDLPLVLPTVDQRGVARAAGSRLDVGAYEAEVNPVVAPAPAAKATIAKQKIKFAPGSSRLTAASKKKLRALATEIQAKGLKKVNLEGYTATLTKAAPSGKVFRVKLSKARTTAVEKYLKQQFKKKGYKVTFSKSSKGAANRVKSNKTEKGRSDNRRVEITIN